MIKEDDTVDDLEDVSFV
jgi:hypothetical protein